MRNLLRANFSRLFKSKIFYLAILTMVGFSAFICWSQWKDMMEYNATISMDVALFNAQVVFGIVSAIFVSLFVGVEYSDGTIRNKLLVGRSRVDIYLANFITAATALAIVYAASTAVAFGLGTLLLEPTAIPAWQLWCAFGVGFGIVLAYTAVYNFIAMLLSNKTYTAILTIMLALGLMICSTFVQSRLDQPEFYQELAPGVLTNADEDVVVGVTEDGEFQEMTLQTVPNPLYLTGAERERYQFFLDVNPSGQTVQLAMLNIPHPARIVLLDLGIVLVFCLGGIALFRRKDIK